MPPVFVFWEPAAEGMELRLREDGVETSVGFGAEHSLCLEAAQQFDDGALVHEQCSRQFAVQRVEQLLR